MALCEAPMTAMVCGVFRGRAGARSLGLRTRSRSSGVMGRLGIGGGREVGEEPVQRMRRGVVSSRSCSDSVDVVPLAVPLPWGELCRWMRTVQVEVCNHISSCNGNYTHYTNG
jgi:hypothetical protein